MAKVADKRRLYVTQKDGSVWAVPVRLVVENRLAYYTKQGDATEFDATPTDDLILDWASNNMDWSDVAGSADKVRPAPALKPADFQDAWINGAREIGA